MHKRLPLPLAAALAVSALLTGCNSQPENITSGGPEDPDAKQVAAAPPVKLPPAMTSDKAYRCKDNSLVYISFFSDDTTAAIRTKKEGTPISLIAPAGGEPFVGSGWTLTGTKDKSSLTVAGPGKPSQTCTSS